MGPGPVPSNRSARHRRVGSCSQRRKRGEYRCVPAELARAERRVASLGDTPHVRIVIEIIFSNILLDKQIITSETSTALLLMAVGSTMLTVPVVHPKLNRVQHRGLVNQASS
jgi:hypothetical protein